MCSCARLSSPMSHITFCTFAELRRPHTFSMGSAPPQRAALAEGVGLPVVDQAAVDAIPADLARQPPVFDLWAAGHDHRQARRLRALLRFLAYEAELDPD